jgi:hypothetical protein
MMYVQCALQKGEALEVVWIPEKFAHAGELLGMKKDGLWNEGWRVVRVYAKLPVRTIVARHDPIVHPWKAPPS